MLESIRIWKAHGEKMQDPKLDIEAKMLLHKYENSLDKEDSDRYLNQLSYLFEEHNQMFQDNMPKFSNIIEKVERRLSDWMRNNEFDSEDERVHPQKWIKFLSDTIDDFVMKRWQWGWEYCSNRLVTIIKEIECTFRDYGYGPCYKSDLATKKAKSTAVTTTRERVLTDQPIIKESISKQRRLYTNNSPPIVFSAITYPSSNFTMKKSLYEEFDSFRILTEEEVVKYCVDEDVESKTFASENYIHLPSCCCPPAVPDEEPTFIEANRGDDCCNPPCASDAVDCVQMEPKCHAPPQNNERQTKMATLDAALKKEFRDT